MAATLEQLTELNRFVAGNPGWTSESVGHEFAARTIPVTEEVGWSLQLRAEHGWWRAFAVHRWEENHNSRDLRSAAQWLDGMTYRARQEQTQVEGLREFVRGRRGWRFVEADRGWSPFGRQVFEFPEVRDVDEVGLFLSWGGDRLTGFRGAVQVPCSPNLEAGTRGGFDEVAHWVDEWRKALMLPDQLRECGSWSEAYGLATRVPASRVAKLADLFGLGRMSTTAARGRLVAMFTKE
ncbi:MAG TPA: hypothetical protein VFX60_19235 [Micromonospora sp.]|nr:hypothetical protein [Micromonospora sp.]